MEGELAQQTQQVVPTLHAAADVCVGIVLAAISFAVLARARAGSVPAMRLPGRALVAFFACTSAAYVAGGLGFWAPVPGAVDIVQSAMSMLTAVAVLVFVLTAPGAAAQRSMRGEVEDLRQRIEQSHEANEHLHDEARELRNQLDASRAELETSAQQFSFALLGGKISVFQQTPQLEYVWMHNPPAGLALKTIAGRRDEDIYDEDVAARLTHAKAEVLETGETRTVPVEIRDGEHTSHYEFAIHQLRDEAGTPVGLSSIAIDVTDHELHAEQLRSVMRELAHRSKNLLAIIIGISNLTAKLTTDAHDFHDRFSDRLRSLSDAHDALAETEWTGADLKEVVERQLAPYREIGNGAVRVDGEPGVWVRPNAVQYLTLALHELAANAATHGAMGRENGTVEISWSRDDPDDGNGRRGLTLEWREHFGDTVAPPQRDGFGKLILEKITPSAVDGAATYELTGEGMTYVLDVGAMELEDAPAR